MGIKESFLATWTDDDESKRDFIYRMIPVLEKTDQGQDAIRRMAKELGEQVSFPDLDGWEESADMKARAVEAVRALKAYLAKEGEAVEAEKARAEARRRAQQLRDEAAREQADLDKLRSRLDQLAAKLGTSIAGYDFQDWFYDLVQYFEIVHRRPYVTDGRQIDGSLTVDGTTYLVELKFTGEQASAPDIDSFFKKVTDKADNTMGIFISVSGYSSVAVDGASVPRTPLLLLEHSHLYAILSGAVTLKDLIGRVRRHSSQTSQAYLSVTDM